MFGYLFEANLIFQIFHNLFNYESQNYRLYSWESFEFWFRI